MAGNDPIVGTQGSSLAQENERRRQVAGADTDFLRAGIYFFELIVPSKAFTPSPPSSTTSILLPLILNPEMITEESRFDVVKTRTNMGGMTVEESGISERVLVIRGHTGWKPRGFSVQAQTGAGKRLSTQNPHFHMREHYSSGVWLSGQKHFQLLQDRIFNTYGELKKDKQFAQDTVLNFHNPKDGKHWRIIPESFKETQVVNRKFLYQYEIIASIVDVAKPQVLKAVALGEDDFFTQMKNAVDKAKREINKLNAELENLKEFVADVQAVISDIASVFTKVAGFLDNVTSIVESIERGIVSVGAVPLAAVLDIADSLDAAAEAAINLPSNVRDAYAANLRRMEDGVLSLALVKEIFQPSPPADLQALNNASSGLYANDYAALTSAEPATSLRKYGKSTSGLDASDSTRIQNTIGSRTLTPYRSIKTIQILKGDTIAVLAARHLGDARRWRELAILNQLQAPYISEAKFPKTLRIGDSIKIPTTDAPQNVNRPSEILGGPIAEKTEDRILGRDLELEERDGLVDLKIDSVAGSQDFSTISGNANLLQGIRQRILVEVGTDPLYPDFGLANIIGLHVPAVDAQLFRLRLLQAVEADPRVLQLAKVTFLPGQDDAISTELSVYPIASDSPLVVKSGTTLDESFLLG